MSAQADAEVAAPRPLRRVLGALLSWLVFGFGLGLLFQIVAIVAGLGGYCATGGPYVIAVECPDAVGLFAPVSVVALLIGWGISIVFAGGFGASSLAWGWTLLFVGLGVQFVLLGLRGDLSSWLIGALSLAMGIVPFVLWWRWGPRDLLIGTHDLRDRPFAPTRETRRRRQFRPLASEGEPVRASALAVVLGAGVPLVGLALGAALALLAIAGTASG